MTIGNVREIQIIDQRDENLAQTAAGMETTRIEQTRGKNLLY